MKTVKVHADALKAALDDLADANPDAVTMPYYQHLKARLDEVES